MNRRAIPDWELLLAHASLLQTKVPGAILVGGTAAALHARHRFSADHDHVIGALGGSYDRALRALEGIAGWKTNRKIRGRLVLGSVDGIAAGLRNQRRSAALETTQVRLRGGGRLRVPTIGEMLRIKAFLILERNATRDYLDVAALSAHMGLAASVAALEPMSVLYAEFAADGGDILPSIVVKFVTPDPHDLTDLDLSEYKGIVAPWNSWLAVVRQCEKLAVALVSPEAAHARHTS